MAIAQEQIEQFRMARQQRVPHYIHFYGMDYLLKKLLGFPSKAPLDVHLDHGVIIRLDKPDQYLAGTNASLIFVDNTIRKNMVPEKRNVFVLGPLFMRYRRAMGFKYNPSARGTIVFPTHSSHHLSLKLDWKKYAEDLAALPSEFQPVTVCLYWLDVLKGEHKYFEDAGLNVICNGHMFDDNYAFNFYTNLVNYKYASGNEPGSFTFYAIEMGMPFFIFGPSAVVVNDGKDKTAGAKFEFNDIDYAKRIKEVFAIDINELKGPLKITDEQRDTIGLYVDDKNWISINKLRYLASKDILMNAPVRYSANILKRMKKKGQKILSVLQPSNNN